jgi:hypothetical protein
MIKSLLRMASGLVLATAIASLASAQDETPPVLGDFGFDPETIDVTDGSADVTCTMRLTDAPAGVTGAICSFAPPDRQIETRFCRMQRISGGANDGVWSCILVFPQNLRAGTWFSSASAWDSSNNNLHLSASDLAAMGFPTELEVISDQQDVLPPVVEIFDFDPKTIDVTAGSADVTCVMRLTDVPAGVDSAGCRFSPPDDMMVGRGCAMQRVSGDASDGVWSCTHTFPQHSWAGTWVLSISAGDTLRNLSFLDPSDLAGMGFSNELEVISEQEDRVPPTLVDFDFDPKTIDVTAGSVEVTCAMRLTDVIGGVDRASCMFSPPDRTALHACLMRRIAGDANDGEWSCVFQFPRNLRAGTWTASISASDTLHNRLSLGASDLAGLGFASELKVIVADIEVLPVAIDFGDVDIGLRVSHVVSLTNLGGADLTVTGVALESGVGSGFSVDSAPVLPATLFPDERVDLEIAFAPSVLGADSAMLQIASNDPDQGIVEVTLSGEGVAHAPSDTLKAILGFFDASVGDETLVGSGPGSSGPMRLAALRNMLESAGELLNNRSPEKACNRLLSALLRTDGVSPPPDFAAGTAASELATQIHDLRTSNGLRCAMWRPGSDRPHPLR